MAQIKGMEELLLEAAKSAQRALEARGESSKNMKITKSDATIAGGPHGTWVGIQLPSVPHLPSGPIEHVKHPIWIGIIAQGIDQHMIDHVQKQIEGKM
jgi:hypothetical protein